MGRTSNLPRKLALDELDQAVEVTMDAFETDPLWPHLIADPTTRSALLPKLYRTFLDMIIRDGELYGTGEPLQGIAWWVLPEEKKTSRLNKLAGYAKLMIGPLRPYIRPLLSFYDEFDRHQKRLVAGPHYYLKAVGISSRSRGEGYASKLIRPYLDQADERKLPVYLEVLSNPYVPIYKHYGFEVVSSGHVGGTNVPMWCMLRRPQRK